MLQWGTEFLTFHLPDWNVGSSVSWIIQNWFPQLRLGHASFWMSHPGKYLAINLLVAAGSGCRREGGDVKDGGERPPKPITAALPGVGVSGTRSSWQVLPTHFIFRGPDYIKGSQGSVTSPLHQTRLPWGAYPDSGCQSAGIVSRG